ncbi:hypothetical protein [Candidatus Fukatsuia symbiotica]|uniref:hypothetical protein n=1 Tax=Candidatus Fukatsuia symbiotica TaxID=1878942 RepID=UPI001967CADF|nr:hypothetical protein [Candidatus Fukatsuia symbiotica]
MSERRSRRFGTDSNRQKFSAYQIMTKNKGALHEKNKDAIKSIIPLIIANAFFGFWW